MAKKQTKATVKETVVEQEVVEIMEQVLSEPQTPTQSYEKPGKDKVVKEPTKPQWEIKDRNYYLTSMASPLSYSIRSSGVHYFDEDKGYERELKYTTNQKTPFVDEFPENTQARLEHIVFRNGKLHVPRNKQTLQKLLSLYHPHRGVLYEEHNPVRKAATQIDSIELEFDAMSAAMSLDIDMAEAVMRVEVGSKVSEMSSKELKRDLLLYAKRNPALFLELVNDDNVQLRNFGIKATELNIIKLSSDQRHFMWGSNDRKLMTVPFDEHPYSALASWFKTDEGMEVYTNIEKRLS
jgi:hypothetical protein